MSDHGAETVKIYKGEVKRCEEFLLEKNQMALLEAVEEMKKEI